MEGYHDGLQRAKGIVRQRMAEIVSALIDDLLDPNTKPADRVKIFEALASRVGLPQVTASVSRSLSARFHREELSISEQEDRYLREIEVLDKEIEEAERLIEGERDDAGEIRAPEEGSGDGPGGQEGEDKSE